QQFVERVARGLRDGRVRTPLYDEERYAGPQGRRVLCRRETKQRFERRVAAKRRRRHETAPRIGAVQAARAAREDLRQQRDRRRRENLVELDRGIGRRGRLEKKRAE